MLRSLHVVHETQDHLVGFCGPVVVTIWRRETTSEGVATIAEAVRLAGSGGAAVSLSIVSEDATLPSTAMRQELANQMASFGGEIARSALVFEGEGFRAAAIRSVVSGISLVQKLPYPHRVFRVPLLALEWLDDTGRSKPSVSLAAREVAREIESVRRFAGLRPSLPG